MAARVAETDLRDSKPEFLCLFPTTSIAVTPLQLKTSDKYSLSTGQSAPRTGDSSSSTRSANSPHHHLRNNSATVISTPNKTSIPRLSDKSSAKRPASSPSTPSYYPSTSTHFNQQPGGLVIDPRLSSGRRQPASRSSHGIETSTGPPPALITQRSNTTDSAWKQPAPLEEIRLSKYRPNTQKSTDSIINSARSATNGTGSAIAAKTTSSVRRRPEMTGDKTGTMAAFERRHRGHDEDQDSTLRNFDPVASSYPNFPANEKISGRVTNNDPDEQTKTSQEDLFLILARSNSLADNANDVTLKGERRRFRMNSFHTRQPHNPMSPSDGRPSSSGRLFAGNALSPSQDSASSQWGQSKRLVDSESPPLAKRSSPRERRYAASAHPLEHGISGLQSVRAPNVTSNASRTRSGSNRETSPELPGTNGRKSIRESSPSFSSRAYKQSNFSYSSNGQYGNSPFPDSMDAKRPQIHHADGTASTLSTTAPSTIWDDVEDLKHRMRKLELTGKLPLTSEAAISNVLNERPPTATTTMTTVSSSPKFGRKASVSPSTVRGTETAEIHPLLHSALAKSKPLIDPSVFRALEATASDALVLAAMGTLGGSQSVPSVTGMDRRFRRKADSMCRSLTELCIALTQEKSERYALNGETRTLKGERIVSIHHNIESGPVSRYLRASSEDPEMRSNSRLLDRLEVRRASMLQTAPPVTHRDTPPEVNNLIPSTTSRLDRPSLTLRQKESTSEAADARPSSRSLLEITQCRSYPSSVERAQREYTSQQPHPTPSTSVQSSLPVRRNYFPTTSTSPITPTVQPGSRRYLDRGSTPPSIEAARAAAEIRRERMTAVSSQRREKRISSRQVGADSPC